MLGTCRGHGENWMFKKSLKKTKFGEELPEATESCLQLEESQILISSHSKPPLVVKCVIHSSLLLEMQAAVRYVIFSPLKA